MEITEGRHMSSCGRVWIVEDIDDDDHSLSIELDIWGSNIGRRNTLHFNFIIYLINSSRFNSFV